MRFKTWPVAALALGALLLLVVAAVLESSRRAPKIFARLDDGSERYHQVESKLRRLRSDVNLSGIYVRDYLLDPDRERAPHYGSALPATAGRTWPSMTSFGSWPATIRRRCSS